MLLVVLSDTHVRDGSGRDLPAVVWRAVEAADAVLHAGDVTGPAFLATLQARAASVRAVLGNNDVQLQGVLPERRVETFGGVRIGMVHDAGPRAGRGARLARWFPGCDLVVFGHSHEPEDRDEAGLHLFNPGSPTERRRQPHRTFGTIEIGAERAIRTELHHTDE